MPDLSDSSRMSLMPDAFSLTSSAIFSIRLFEINLIGDLSTMIDCRSPLADVFEVGAAR